MIDVVQLVRDGAARYEWEYVVSDVSGSKLYVAVLRDAMKFDGMPALNWRRQPVAGSTDVFNGVRLPATPTELQQIADMIGAMLLTPRIIDLIWLQAGLKFNANINNGINGAGFKVVAEMNVTDVHKMIEADVAALGGDDDSKIVECVGKYWCLVNGLGTDSDKKLYGTDTACNYGWCSSQGSGPGVTPGVLCFQRPGFKHNRDHIDPSQTIRLMFRQARLVEGNGSERYIDLHDVAADPALAPHIAYDSKPLKYLRQTNVPEEAQIGTVVLPPVVIEAEQRPSPKAEGTV